MTSPSRLRPGCPRLPQELRSYVLREARGRASSLLEPFLQHHGRIHSHEVGSENANIPPGCARCSLPSARRGTSKVVSLHRPPPSRPVPAQGCPVTDFLSSNPQIHNPLFHQASLFGIHETLSKGERKLFVPDV